MLNTTAFTPQMPERKVLSRRRLLHEKTSFTVPEHGVRTRPPDVDVLPEARCKRRLNVVVQIARGPLLVGSLDEKAVVALQSRKTFALDVG
jgi:hypothetical protein